VVAQEEEELEELLLLLTAASQLNPLSTEPKNSVHCCYPRANTAAAAWPAAGSNETKRGTSTTTMMQTNAQAMPMALTVCLSPCVFRAD
jgi:hypothetical protein